MFPMFPFWGNSCCGSEPISHKANLERKLKFLTWIRDDLESRLAAVNASIDTIRQQIERSDTAA
ncbi:MULTISPECIES: hypothetical protein [Calothrix]|uniref:Uncharacterized protein n=2 Tax=Calothrix TaxID=1186 RepID=A0ABR8AJY6_9CYAN|nr:MULTISPECIES: hypothetical protein [Calothrix]BAY61156.1 hypothetical protein NIES22_12170 [Calothrix brevissima NIES-22]MBD2200327.1 hypothetical protein [Calothrix parietina FACHB-288]MBD2203101.1 hypothetical protein [Calothrix sp. FACHB-168]MBD2218702.1 hypothetical protein [Calothrix sp. FACHB-1219]MBD2228951.1 hypothetical protein [Calothrix anomala FACHB-343]